jgi:hypothetical protein
MPSQTACSPILQLLIYQQNPALEVSRPLAGSMLNIQQVPFRK